MSRKFSIVGVIILILGLIFVPLSHAGAGGFRLFASDAEAIGKGGAFAAEADNASAVLYNPAGLTQLKGKTHLSLGSTAIQPMVKHTSASGIESQMRRETFVIPHFYAVSDFGLPNVVFGLGSTASWGLATRWNDDSFSRYVATKTEVTNMDNMLMMGLKLNENISIGGGLIYDMSEVNKNAKINQVTADGSLQLKGDDEAFGYSAAGLFKINERHQIGVVYKSEIELEYKGKVHLNGLNNNNVLPGPTSYQAVFGGTNYSTDARADLVLPQSVVLGYSFRPSEKWIFNADVEWMDWSSFERESLTFESETDPTRLSILQTATTIDRDWDSTINGSIGAEYAYNDKLSLRGGYFYNQTPIPEENFDTTVPGSDSHGFNAGFGYGVTNDMIVDLAWTGMLFEERDVSNSVGDAFGGPIDGEYENFVNILTLTLNYKFN